MQILIKTHADCALVKKSSFLKKMPAPKEWKLLGENELADCKVFKVWDDLFAHPDGRTGNFYICKTNDWVQVAAITTEGKIILVNQFRFGVKKTSWEFSGGVIERGEDIVAAGLRELEEETGYVASSAKLVASFSPNPAIQNNQAHVVIAVGCKKLKSTNWDKNEEIEIKEVDASELDNLISSGQIHHSIAINGIYFLQKYLEKQGNAPL